MTDLTAWATRWHIPTEALRELFALSESSHSDTARGEADVLKQCQMAAPAAGMRLWRNNTGAGKLDNGSFVRWGLCNESERMNRVVKSSDLIGIRREVITSEHVGQTVGRFVAIETKAPGWHYSGTEREAAQAAFLTLVKSFGGIGEFVTDAGQLERAGK